MPKVTLYLNDGTDPNREFAKEVYLRCCPRKGELVMVKGYGGALTVEEIHHCADQTPPETRVFFSHLPPQDFDRIIGADPSWRES